jgi:hypothetical protein
VQQGADQHEQWLHKTPFLRAIIFQPLDRFAIASMSSYTNESTHHHIPVSVLDRVYWAQELMKGCQAYLQCLTSRQSPCPL